MSVEPGDVVPVPPESRTERGRPATRWARAGWTASAAGLIAFAAFEMVAHAGATLWLGLVGALAPDLPRLVRRRGAIRSWPAALGHRLTHSLLLPGALVVWYCLNTDTNAEAAPGFTLGLVWLAHISVDRALGRGRGRSRASGSGVVSGASLISHGPPAPTIGS